MQARGGHLEGEFPPVALAKLLSHPMRVRILMTMHAPLRSLSPSQFAEESGESLSSASYHFRELRKAKCVKVIDTIPRRGATEHIYFPIKRAMAWSREWESLGSVVKQNLAASALRQAVELIGEAIDCGTFEELPDSVLTWDAMRVNMEGWQKCHDIAARATKEFLEVGEEYKDLVDGLPPDDVFIVSYLMATFESPLPDAL